MTGISLLLKKATLLKIVAWAKYKKIFEGHNILIKKLFGN